MRHRQRGAALMLFLIILVMGTLTYVVTSFTPAALEARRARQTHEALAQAREALIGYALRYREDQIADGQFDRVYGYLPLPDLGSTRNNNTGCLGEGCDAANFAGNALNTSVIGRLPWRTLGTGPLRDGHGECLWFVVSGSHQRQQRVVPMNWDTLGHLDIVVADGTDTLASILSTAHARPIAVIFSPGPPLPGQDRGRPLSPPPAGDDVTQCGGNYNAKNYLDPAAATALGSVTNYLAGTNNASGSTGDSNPANDPDAPKALLTRSKVLVSGSNFFQDSCGSGDCPVVANDIGLPITGDTLFGALRKNANFRTDINSMLDRMVSCLRDQTISSGFADRIPDNACYDSSQSPQGYYDHYKELIFLAKPMAPFTVNGDNTCDGALIFAGQRNSTQQRFGAQKNDFSNYLDPPNFPLTGTTFAGSALFDRSPPQAPEQDIVRCIPTGSTFTTVTSPDLTAQDQLVAYDAATRTLTLGKQGVVFTGKKGGAPAAALFGCAWLADIRERRGGFRAYFRFQFKKVGSNVGSNGFVFAIADALRNSYSSCGAAGSHLGYSGDNGRTPKIAFPKIGIEFDQGRNTGFDENPLDPGRNDPCGTSSCGGTAGYNSHAAIVYWGHASANLTDAVTLPDSDDNVHGFPSAASLPGPRLPPRSHSDPVMENGIKFVNMRGYPNNSKDSLLYHVRVEVTPTRNVNADAMLSNTSLQTAVWIEGDASLTNQIAALRNTSRPMSLLYSGYAATLNDTATLYDVQEAACSSGVCPSGQTCGSDGYCYRPALQSVQLGFAGSQYTTDQEVNISDFFTTWLP